MKDPVSLGSNALFVVHSNYYRATNYHALGIMMTPNQMAQIRVHCIFQLNKKPLKMYALHTWFFFL
jgi:hypothetical protein